MRKVVLLFVTHIVFLLSAQESKSFDLMLLPPPDVRGVLNDSLSKLTMPLFKPETSRSLILMDVIPIKDLDFVTPNRSVVPYTPEGFPLRAPYVEPYNSLTLGIGLTGGTLGMPIIGGINIISPYIWMNVGEKLHLRLGNNMMQYAELSYINNIVTPYLPVGNNIINQVYLSSYYEVTPWFRLLGEAKHTFRSNFPMQFGMFLPPDQTLSVGGAVKVIGPLGVAVKREYEFYNGKMVPRFRIEPYIFEERNSRPYVSKKERDLRKVKAAYGGY